MAGRACPVEAMAVAGAGFGLWFQIDPLPALRAHPAEWRTAGGDSFPWSPSPVTHTFDVVILGAGAAGLMCAIEAGRRGRRVAVLERSERIGKKILISGGGRCNFTNLDCRPD